MDQNKKRIISHDGMKNSFGFSVIEESEKQNKINNVFHSVAQRYDLMNDIMSSGMHRIWKNAFIAWLSPPRSKKWHLLDVAGGTGDIAFKAIKASGNLIQATILDINSSMLSVGKERALKKNINENIQFVESNAEDLPFSDNQFDAYTIAFGIRNVPDIEKALAQAYRVLKPGGRFLCLEFSEVELPGLDKLYDFWSFYCIPKIGKKITGDEAAYQYLVESIRKFPNQKNFKTLIEKQGFQHVTYRNLTGGIVAMHSGWKI